MPLHRAQLPIVGACPIPIELRADARGRAWCRHCEQPVHVLAQMRESEVRALMARHAGGTFCAEYRMRADGMIAVQPEPARPLLATALAGLAACSTVEDGATIRPRDAAWADEQAGCPSSPRPRAPEAPEPAAMIRVDVELPDDDDVMHFGMVAPAGSSPLSWTPTKELWREFVDRVRARLVARRR